MPGDWAIIEVIARGDLVTVKVNGNIAPSTRDDKRDFARSATSPAPGCQRVVEFRRVEIEGPDGARGEKVVQAEPGNEEEYR